MLGKIKNVELRSIWKNEASDFTPWLAENIAELGDAIGLELEFEGKEVSVGPYSADILAKDTGTGQFVVIENQLEKTNHEPNRCLHQNRYIPSKDLGYSCSRIAQFGKVPGQGASGCSWA